jgi:tetratricopeptide (TPR) repeat protein
MGIPVETLGAVDRAPRIIFVEEADIMTANVFRWPVLVLGFAVAISLAPGISSAQNARLGSESGLDRDMQQNVVKKDEVMQPNVKVKVNKAEEAAYKVFLAAQNGDPATRIQLGEDFAAKFPMSHYLPGIYGVLTSSYFATGDTDKMFAAGSKAIQLEPENVDVLSLLAMAIPRRVKATTPDGAQRLQTAEAYAHRTIEIIPTMTKPATVGDAEFEKAKNDKLALAHSGLGLIDIGHQKYDDAKTELTQAVQLASSPDPVDYYLLGNADVQGSYYKDAVAAYEKCAASGPLVAQCKARAESAKHDAETKLGR